MLDPLAFWIASLWLALLMLHAGLSKVRDRWSFAQHLAAYHVPERWVAPLGLLLPVLECLAGASLLTPWRVWGAALCASLLSLYAGAMAWHLLAGRRVDCGCGGEPLPISWALVLRNVLLLMLCWPAFLPVADRVLHWGDQAVMAGAVVLGALLWAVFHQVLRQMRRASAV
jgi:hypothetical protein